MNKLKHTPGPWTYSKGHIGSVLADFVSCNKKTMDGMHIHNGEEMRGYSTEESEANARLIAAAPEMLQALIRIRSELAPHVGSPTKDKINLCGILVNLCDRKIEKGTGQKIEELI